MRCPTSFSFSLHFIFLILVLGVVVDWSEGGRILRAWRQRNANGHGSRGRSPWAQFHTHRRSFRDGRRRLPPIHHLRQELAGSKNPAAAAQEAFAAGAERRAFAGADGKVLGEASLLRPIDPSTAAASGLVSRSPSVTARQRSWPFLNAIGRDPTFDYVPPTNEQVKFITETQRRAGAGRPPGPPRPFGRRRPPMRPRFRRPPPPNRYQWNRRKTQYSRQPPLLWKLLSSRRNRWRNFRRPPPRPRPNASQEAETAPYMPHIVFFQHSDMMHPKNNSADTNSTITISSNSSLVLRPGKVTSVPLYPVQSSSPSEFIPIPSATPGKEYIFRVVELKHLKRPTVTPATTAGTQEPVYKSVPPPFEPLPTASTETITLMKEVADLNPPAPIENVEINIDAQAEGSDHFLRVVSPPSTTTVSTTTTTTTTTLKPIFALREEPAHVEEIIVPRTSAEAKVKKPGFQHLLPTYNSNKKSTGLGTKKPISSKEYRESREEIGSSIMITGIRSKVKEYKPQLLANFSQLIAFDKVITPVVEVMAKPAKYGFSSRSNAEGEAPSSETTVPPSPDAASNSVDEGSANASSSSEEVGAAVAATNSTISVSSSSSESVSFSNSNSNNNPSVSSASNPDSDSNSESDSSSTTTSTESPMERFDPLKLIHSWFMKT